MFVGQHVALLYYLFTEATYIHVFPTLLPVYQEQSKKIPT